MLSFDKRDPRSAPYHGDTINNKNNTNTFISVVKKELEGFLQVTAVKGFQFAKHSAHWIESIFWIAILFGATVLAARDVRKAWEEYSNENTLTSLRVKGLQNLTLDDAIICVLYDPRGLNLSDPRLLERANASLIVELSRNANLTTVEFLSRSLKLFTAITLVEIGRPADYEEKIAELMENETVQELQTWLQMRQVDIFKLGAEVGNWLCHAMQIRINILKRGIFESSVNPCEPERITWLGVTPFGDISMSETAVCVHASRNISFENMDRIIVSLNTDGLFPVVPAANRARNYLFGSFFDFSPNPVTTDMTKDFLQFPRRGCLAVEIGVDAEMELLDRRVARCNVTAKTRFKCFAECDVLRYKQTEGCNCTQLAWRYLYNSPQTLCFDTHTIQQHLDCRRQTNSSESCYRSCLFPCVFRYFGVTNFQPCEEPDHEGDGRVSLELTPKRFTIPVFEERFSPTVSELFSRVGGTCGLWLGVGIIGICHVLLFPFKLLMKLVVQHSS